MRVEARHDITAPVVALTFDDGPSQWTLPIAEALERHGSRGTFFALGDATAAPGGGRDPAAPRRRRARGGQPHVHSLRACGSSRTTRSGTS